MAKNAKKVVDDDTTVPDDIVEDLKKAKDEVENSQEEDDTSKTEESTDESKETGEEEGKTDDSQEEEAEETEQESDEDSSEFVKEFPNIKGDTLEDYTRELERTLQLSNTEGKRLSDELKKQERSRESLREGLEEDTGPVDPRLLYLDQLLNKDIQNAFDTFKKSFPQVNDPTEYDKFQTEVSVLSKYFIDTQKRAAPASELYSKAAVILGWEPQDSPPDGKERLGTALKDRAAVSKTVSATKKPSKSKVTDQMIAVNRLLYPDKTDSEIREELEPYVK